MPVTPRIFISHSASGDVFATEAVTAITARLRSKAMFDVKQSIELQNQPGSEWRSEVYTWVRSCHAAVVVLSDKVLQHPAWVLHETSILRARRHWEGTKFVIVPVLLPPLTSACLNETLFSPLALGEFQAIREITVAAIVNRVWKALKSLLGSTGPLDTGMGRIQFAITKCLEPVDPAVLEHAAGVINLPLVNCGSSGESCPALFGRTLLELDYRGVMAVVMALAEVDQDTATQAAKMILKHLAPFWVQPAAAARLTRATREVPPGRAVALNGSADLATFTPRMYIQRACSDTKNWPIAEPSYKEQEHAVESLARDILETFKQRLLPGEDPAFINDDRVARAIHDRDAVSPQIVLLGSNVPDSTVDALRGDPRFSTVTFLSYSSEVPDSTALQQRKVQLVEPLLAPEEDRTNWRVWNLAQQVVEGGLTG